MVRKPKQTVSEDDPDLLTHIRSLGLNTVAEYVGWCGGNGFSRRKAKHWRLRMKERAYASRAIAEARLAQKKQEVKKPDQIIERIFSGELREEDVTQAHFKAVCRAVKSAQES